MRTSKFLNLSVLLFMVMLNGCSVDSFLFSAEPEKPLVLIEHPPNRIGYWGKINEADIKNMQKLYEMMQKDKYEPHVYKFPMGADLKHDAVIEKGRTFTGSTSIHKKGHFK